LTCWPPSLTHASPKYESNPIPCKASRGAQKIQRKYGNTPASSKLKAPQIERWPVFVCRCKVCMPLCHCWMNC
jgi:hypothetical protein